MASRPCSDWITSRSRRLSLVESGEAVAPIQPLPVERRALTSTPASAAAPSVWTGPGSQGLHGDSRPASGSGRSVDVSRLPPPPPAPRTPPQPSRGSLRGLLRRRGRGRGRGPRVSAVPPRPPRRGRRGSRMTPPTRPTPPTPPSRVRRRRGSREVLQGLPRLRSISRGPRRWVSRRRISSKLSTPDGRHVEQTDLRARHQLPPPRRRH